MTWVKPDRELLRPRRPAVHPKAATQLDMAAGDVLDGYGDRVSHLVRRTNETDAVFRERIRKEMRAMGAQAQADIAAQAPRRAPRKRRDVIELQVDGKKLEASFAALGANTSKFSKALEKAADSIKRDMEAAILKLPRT